MIDSEMVGKRIRVINLAEEPDIINKRYSGRTGVIDYVDDMGQYHIKWDDGGTGGLAVIPDVDDFEILDESMRYPRILRLMEGKALTSEEKMDRWHNGKRKENIKACSDEKLAEYLKICRKKGYTEEIKLINAERKARKAGSKKINESFDNAELTKMITEHGGLKSFKDVRGYDARGYESSYDLKTAVAQCYIPKELADYFSYFNVFEPMVDQILYCNDGGAIVISNDYNRHDPEYPAYEKKMRTRNDAFREKYGEPHFRWSGVDRTGTTNRRKERHGIGDKEPFFSNY
jgi:hypothetical protein